MSIDILIQGRLRAPIELRTSAAGKEYARFKMHALDKKGNTVPVNCTSFLASVVDKLRDLAQGDAIVVSGEAEISAWTGPDGIAHHGLDVIVHATLTAYHLAMRRADKRQASEERP
jgi:hypothetical protein